MRRGEHDFVRREIEHSLRLLNDRFAQRFTGARVRRARLGHHDQSFRAGSAIQRWEHRDAAFPNPGERADGFLELLRVNVAPRALDEILDASGDEDVAAGDVTAIARLQPVAIDERSRLFGALEIALRRRRALELQPPLMAFWRFAAVVVDDADLMVRQRLAAGDDGGLRQ